MGRVASGHKVVHINYRYDNFIKKHRAINYFLIGCNTTLWIVIPISTEYKLKHGQGRLKQQLVESKQWPTLAASQQLLLLIYWIY